MKERSLVLTLALVPIAIACGSESSDVSDDSADPIDCDAEVVPGYSELSIFADVCTHCHSSDLEGPDRNGAPSTLNFDTYESASEAIARILGQVKTGHMPPADSGYVVTTEQKHDLYLWADCDMPR